MNWIDEVRQRLEYANEKLLIDLDTLMWEAGTVSKVLIEVREANKQALAAIPDEDPMEKLLTWLYDNYNLDNAMVIKYIREELGYKLEDD